jgi:hypothetical protein
MRVHHYALLIGVTAFSAVPDTKPLTRSFGKVNFYPPKSVLPIELYYV